MKLEGSLDTFALHELVEMAAYSSVTGVLNICGPGEQGRLYFREGVLYHVQRGPAQGVEALAELLELSRANFDFVSDITVATESLWGPLSQHLQSAERIAARWRLVRPYVPHLDLTPSLLMGREAALRRLSPAHQPVLAAIDGRACLRQIAASLGWAAIDLAEAIVQMTVDGLIDLRTSPAEAAPAMPAAATRPQAGIFDRLRARSQPPPRHGGEAEPTRAAESRISEDLILKLLRS